MLRVGRRSHTPLSSGWSYRFQICRVKIYIFSKEVDRSCRRAHTQSTLSMQSVGTTSGTSSSPVPPGAFSNYSQDPVTCCSLISIYQLLSAVTEQKLGPILEAALLKVNTRNKLLSNPHHTLSSQGAPAQSEGWQSGEGHCKVESSIVFLLNLFPQHRFRAMLSAEESRSTGAVRMRIAKQLAEVLFTINSNTAKLQQLEYISSL